ncbi:tripartite tricarboxylate transporter substrate binding protein [Pigmentiphaga soli]|uniref:Tripartite tricarboxylate transporter substrate binding protein n=1 Tax=Pigmentiphaga soli TaxID=1007095 RepID=A0ABP8GV04_9BURK
MDPACFARRCGALLSAFACMLPAARAADYPTRPIRIVLGSGAGGLADVTTRLLAQKLAERLGQSVVVENKPGAGGITATDTVAKSAPDGYTLMVMVTGNTIAKSLLKSLPYDLEKDFTPIGSIAFFDLLLLVRNDGPLRTLDDLRKLAASRPGGINVGTTSTGSVQNLTAHLFGSRTGMKISIIPYKTSGEILIGLMRGDVDIGFDAYTSLKSGIDSHQIRAIASTGPQRSDMLPAVPTMKELGLKDYEVIGWNSLYAPAGTPPQVVALLNRNIGEILALPDVRKRFLELGVEARAGTPQEMARLMKSNIDQWAAVIKSAGIEQQ